MGDAPIPCPPLLLASLLLPSPLHHPSSKDPPCSPVYFSQHLFVFYCTAWGEGTHIHGWLSPLTQAIYLFSAGQEVGVTARCIRHWTEGQGPWATTRHELSWHGHHPLPQRDMRHVTDCTHTDPSGVLRSKYAMLC